MKDVSIGVRNSDIWPDAKLRVWSSADMQSVYVAAESGAFSLMHPLTPEQAIEMARALVMHADHVQGVGV